MHVLEVQIAWKSNLVKLINADHSSISQHHCTTLHDKTTSDGVSQHGGSQTSSTAALTRRVDLTETITLMHTLHHRKHLCK